MARKSKQFDLGRLQVMIAVRPIVTKTLGGRNSVGIDFLSFQVDSKYLNVVLLNLELVMYLV